MLHVWNISQLSAVRFLCVIPERSWTNFRLNNFCAKVVRNTLWSISFRLRPLGRGDFAIALGAVSIIKNAWPIQLVLCRPFSLWNWSPMICFNFFLLIVFFGGDTVCGITFAIKQLVKDIGTFKIFAKCYQCWVSSGLIWCPTHPNAHHTLIQRLGRLRLHDGEIQPMLIDLHCWFSFLCLCHTFGSSTALSG